MSEHATRVVHCKSGEPYDVYVGRPGPWGNPFSHKPSMVGLWRVVDRGVAISAFREWVLTSDTAEAQWIRDHVHELRGKTLGCWCAPKACHGEVLARMADESGWPGE